MQLPPRKDTRIAMEAFAQEWKSDAALNTERLFLFEVLVSSRLPAVSPSGRVDDTLHEDSDGCPTATLFCKSESGQTVNIFVKNWRPWLRILCASGNPWDKCKALHYSLNRHIFRTEHGKIKKLYGWEAADDLSTFEYYCTKIFVKKLFALQTIADTLQGISGIIVSDVLQKPRTRFLHDAGLSPCAWFSLRAHKVIPQDARKTTGVYELECSFEDIVPLLDLEAVPPITIASFDCEMSSGDGLLPSPHKGDALFCLSTSFSRFGTIGVSSCVKTVSIYLGESDAVSSSNHLILHVSKQSQVLETWRQLFLLLDPDIVTGWNIEGFDFPFLAQSYTCEFDDIGARGTDAIQQDFAEKNGIPRIPLSKLCASLSNSQKSSVLSKMISEFGPTLASILRPILKASDGSSELIDQDEEEEDAQPSSLAPKYHLRLRSLCFALLGKTDETLRFCEDADDYMSRPRRTGPKTGMFLSRFITEECKLETRTMNTAAKGDNIMEKIPMGGRVVVDMMRVIKDDQKPASNALRYAADTWLGSDFAKLDLPTAELFEIYKTKNKEGAARVIDYCARDAEIPLLLMLKLQYLTSWFGLCRVCYLNPDTIVNGGQQQRVFSLIAKRVRDTHAIHKEPSGWPGNSDYVGATVIEPKAAFYEKPLSTLDFASLYPSIEASNNLCFSTLVTDRSQLSKLVRNGKKLYQDFEIKHPRADGSVETRHYAFVTHVPSVLAELLIHLMSSRKAVKKQMEGTPDRFLKEIYNKRQLALKVVCNSVYGFTGVDPDKGMLSCKPVAAATTLIGRRLIGLTKDYVEKNFAGSDVVYGDTDSVMIYWGVDSLEEAFALGEKSARDVTLFLRNLMKEEQSGGERDVETMAAIIKLEHEKEYWPYLLLKKKNYAARKWVPKSLDPLVFADEIDIKGVQAVRRDTCPIVANLSNAVIDALLLEKSAQRAIDVVRETLRKVSLGQVPIADYIISKSIKSSYTATSLPHVCAWERMRDRGDEDQPPVGGRMPFVITQGPNPALSARAEHPAHVSKHSIKIDTPYYITAAKNPIKKLLQFSDDGMLDEIFADAMNMALSRNTTSLLEFCSGDISQVKSAPTPPRKKQKTSGTVGLAAFFKA